MEAAVIILVIAFVLLIFSKRFKSLVRNDFYLEKPETGLKEHCKPGRKVDIRFLENKRQIGVYCSGKLIGLVPDDYRHIVERKLHEEEQATGELVKVNKHGYKIHVEMKGEVRDIVQ